MVLGSLNVTHWSCWRKVETEEAARAQIWFVQEHHLVSRHAVKRSRKALARAGWCSAFGLAAPTAKGGTSGGAAVLLRDNFDVLSQLDVHDADRHRAKGVVTRLGGIEAAVWSFYGDCRSPSCTARVFGQLLAATPHGLPLIVGGDFNLAPADAAAGLLRERPDLALVTSGGPTCRVDGVESELDYFIVSRCLLDVLVGGGFSMNSAVPTHAAVGIRLQLADAPLLTEWIRPPVPDARKVFGPRYQAPPEQASTPLAAIWLDRLLGAESPRRVGALRGCSQAAEVVEADWWRWCWEARRELEANTGSSFSDFGAPYRYRDYDPCKRAAQGVARSRGVPVGPSRQYLSLIHI